MKLFSFLKRKPATPRRGTAHRFQPQVENLEERQLMAANLYLDFGFALPGGSLTVTDAQMKDPGLNGPSSTPTGGSLFGNGFNLISLTRSVQNQKIDLNGDGRFDTADANALANKVIANVQRTFAPFDVNVIAVSSANLNGIKSYLALRNTHDSYVLIAGDSPLAAGNWGIGPEDVGNAQDNLATVFADKCFRDTVRAGSWDQRVNALAGAILHEAGHNFGLHHSDYSQSITAGDVMGAPSAIEGPSTQFAFTRFRLPREGGGTQVSYDILGANVGFKPAYAAYVTGTGLHDRINVTWFTSNLAVVDVYAYSDHDWNQLVSTYSYFISTANGIQVEAGFGDDQIVLDARLATTVDVRGGSGSDEVVVNAAAGPTVVTVNGDTVTAGNTKIWSDTYWESEGLTINGNSLTTVNVQSTRSTLPVSVVGAGAVNIGWSGTLNSVFGNIAGDVDISNPTGKTVLNVDDSKDTSSRDQIMVGTTGIPWFNVDGYINISGYINGLAPGNITWQLGEVSGVTLQTGTGGATVNVESIERAPLTLAGNSNNTTVNVGYRGKVSGIRSELHIQNAPAYTTVNIDDSQDWTARTITFDNDRITGLAPAAISFNALDLQALNVKAGSGGNTIYVNNTPYRGLTTLDSGTGADVVSIRGTRAGLTVNGDGGDDFTIIGYLSSVANLHGDVLLTGNQTILIDDMHDQLVRSVTLDSWAGRYDSIVGLAPARISYRPAANADAVLAGYQPDGATHVNLQAGPGVVGFTIAANHVPLTLSTQGYPGINVGHDGTAQDVVAPIRFQNWSGFNSLYVDDSADRTARTVTVDTFTDDNGLGWGRIDGLTPGQITYSSNVTPTVALRTGYGGGEVDLLSATGVNFNLVNYGDTLIRLGNQGTVDDWRSNLSVSSLGGKADIYIDDSLNAAAKTITLAAGDGSLYGGYLSVRGLTPRNLSFQLGAVRYLELNAGMGGNTFTISGQPPFLAKVNTGAGDDTVTLQGNVAGVSVDGQDGVNTLHGPDTTPAGASENVWVVDGPNSGTLNNYSVVFSNVNIVGGAAVDHFIMYDSLGLAGPLDGGGGVNTLDYSYWFSDVYVNLQTGTASGFPGGIVNIQNVTGGAGTNLLVGNGGNVLTGGTGRNLLIAGGDSTLVGGDGEDVLIAGTTAYDTDDATLAAMMAVWADAESDFDSRLAALPLLDATTVTPGAGGSVLTGGGGRDAFFARMDLDVVTDMDDLNDVFTGV